MNPITRKCMLKVVIQPSFRAVGQKHVEWQTFEKPENRRQMLVHPSLLPYIVSYFGLFRMFVISCVHGLLF